MAGIRFEEVEVILGQADDLDSATIAVPIHLLHERRLCWMQRQRYWVERCFEDGKSQCGMADYQLRLWNAWHHHMALVMMAMLFMPSEKGC